jgi:glyoxylase-like metal-dependent hydrolase (beta-lactamase superfamily II)
MKITPLTVGQMSTNCYLASDEATGQSLIIDPGDEGDFIGTTLLENKLIPVGIVLTHGHFDHCLAVIELKLSFNIPIYLHPKDLFLYQKAHSSAKHWSPISTPKLPPIDKFLSEEEIIPFGRSSLKVIHTPGHTPGSICLLSPSNNREPTTNNSPLLFTGDTLFAEGVGRTDLSYSSSGDLQKSLNKLFALPSDTLIYPGHENTPVFLSDITQSD